MVTFSQVLVEIFFHVKEIKRATCITGKVFWSILFIVCSSGLTYQLGTVFVVFSRYDSVTDVQIGGGIPLPFPSPIEICSQTPLNISTILNRNISSRDTRYIFALFRPKDPFENATFDFLKEYEELYRNSVTMNDIMDRRIGQTVMEYGFKCEGLFLECVVHSTPFDCCANMTVTIQDHGQCFRINLPREHWKQSIYGARGAIRIALRRTPDVQEYVVPESDDSWYLQLGTEFDGGTVQESQPSLVMRYRIHHDITAQVLLELQRSSYLPNPYLPDCESDPNYSIITCMQQYETNATIRYCGCVSLGMAEMLGRDYDHIPYCMASKNAFCVTNALRRTSSEQLNCRNPCDMAKLVPTLLFRDLTNTRRRKKNDKSIEIEIFYNNFEVVRVIQRPTQSLESLISTIGGQMAFWLGVRVFSFVQIVYHMTKFIKWNNSSEEAERPARKTEVQNSQL